MVCMYIIRQCSYGDGLAEYAHYVKYHLYFYGKDFITYAIHIEYCWL